MTVGRLLNIVMPDPNVMNSITRSPILKPKIVNIKAFAISI